MDDNNNNKNHHNNNNNNNNSNRPLQRLEALCSAPISQEMPTYLSSPPIGQEMPSYLSSAPIGQEMPHYLSSAPIGQEMPPYLSSAPIGQEMPPYLSSAPIGQEMTHYRSSRGRGQHLHPSQPGLNHGCNSLYEPLQPPSSSLNRRLPGYRPTDAAVISGHHQPDRVVGRFTAARPQRHPHDQQGQLRLHQRTSYHDLRSSKAPSNQMSPQLTLTASSSPEDVLPFSYQPEAQDNQDFAGSQLVSGSRRPDSHAVSAGQLSRNYEVSGNLVLGGHVTSGELLPGNLPVSGSDLACIGPLPRRFRPADADPLLLSELKKCLAMFRISKPSAGPAVVQGWCLQCIICELSGSRYQVYRS